jgi:mono/diheme cytochrome c family protein
MAARENRRRLVVAVAVAGAVWAGTTTGARGADPAAPPGAAAGKARAGVDAQQVARGKYLTAIMDCSGCHTPGSLAGKPDGTRLMAGSEIGFAMPGLGVVYPKNLTPDPETGLGAWSVEEIIRAVRQGKSRDGRDLAPVMPWHAYAALTDRDARALAVYLRSLPAIRNEPPRNVKEGEKPPAPYLSVIVPQ